MTLDADAAKPSLNSMLHGAGMRATLPRRAVLETIVGSDLHRSAEEVRRSLAERGVELPRSSVNNILGALARAGLIGRVDTLPGPTRFEHDATEHDHFWCVSCRVALNVSHRSIEVPPLPGSLTWTSVTYLGRCETCLHRSDESSL